MKVLDHNKDGVLLDLSAAFDMVDHQILSRRLFNTFHIAGKGLNCIKSYLHGRFFRVCLEDSLSEFFVAASSINAKKFEDLSLRIGDDVIQQSSKIRHEGRFT